MVLPSRSTQTGQQGSLSLDVPQVSTHDGKARTCGDHDLPPWLLSPGSEFREKEGEAVPGAQLPGPDPGTREL